MSPDDVAQWTQRRRNSIDQLAQEGFFELDDTSPALAPSEMTSDDAFTVRGVRAQPPRRRSMFRLVV